MIPHLYDGRKKTVLLVNWEGFGLRQGQTFVDTVPTQAERSGDLSALGVPIYDPLTTCGVSGGPACAPGEPQYNRQEIPNANVSGMMNPTAVAYMNTFYPMPNSPGVNGQDNYINNTSVGGNNYQTVVHIDQDVSAKQHISGRYTYWINYNDPIDPLGTGICYDRCGETFRTNNGVLDDTYTFNSTTILDVHLSYLRSQSIERRCAPTSTQPALAGLLRCSRKYNFPGRRIFRVPTPIRQDLWQRGCRQRHPQHGRLRSNRRNPHEVGRKSHFAIWRRIHASNVECLRRQLEQRHLSIHRGIYVADPLTGAGGIDFHLICLVTHR